MSYVSQQFLLRDMATLANFKNWGSAISAAFASMGWIQTADTGQVNWSTVASVPTSGNYVYEIWKPADALQTGSTAYFFKFEYGNNSSNAPIVRLSLAHSTDGAGTLQAPVVGPYTGSGAAGDGSTAVRECNFSGDLDRMSVNLWRDAANANQDIAFAIERTKDTAGVDTSEGVTIYCQFQASSGIVQGTLSFSPLLVLSLGNLCHLYTSTSDLAANNNIPVSPVFPVYLGKFGNPSTGMALVPQNDIAEGGIFTCTLYGATRTYLASKRNTFASQAVCIRYD